MQALHLLENKNQILNMNLEFRPLYPSSANGIQREIQVNGQKLGTVTSFKYLGEAISPHGSKPAVVIHIAQATASPTKWKPIWRDNNIPEIEALPYHFHTYLYASESGNLYSRVRERKASLSDEILPKARFAERFKQPLKNMMNF